MKKLLVALAFVFATAPVAPVLAQSAQEQAAVTAAQSSAQQWLSLLFSNDLAASHREASELFKTQVTADQWAQQVQQMQQQLGGVVSRKLAAAKYLNELPGAPPGNYVVLVFQTSFQKRKSAIETLTQHQDAQGYWRAAMYQVQ